MFHLPEHVSTSSIHVQAECPGAAYVTRDIWLVSDGYGRAYLIRTPANAMDRTMAHLIASWELMVGEASMLIPFQLHYATPITLNLGLAILSCRTTFADMSSTTKAPQTFDICAVRISLPDLSASSFDQLSSPNTLAMPIPFEVAWRRRSSHIPLFTTYCPTRDAFLFLGGSPYYDISQPVSQPYKPAPDELVPVPRGGECLDNNRSDPPPYSWTQNDDTVTIAFALPSTTLTTSIHATFETGTLSLRIGPPALPQLLYAAAPLWDAIHPASSLWTWERSDTDTAGVLTMHLDKAHPSTRWSHVFAQGFEARETPETLDPSELAGIRENLDKFTVSLQHDANALGHGVPSLAEGERDNEVDASIGDPVVLTWVGSDGITSCTTDDASAVLLSLPLPGAKDSFPPSLVVKNDIDGLLYTLDEGDWTHRATYPALAFVLASKRDTRFTFHVHSAMALAFESGARNDGSGNVYLYYGSAPCDKWAKQSVLQQQPGVGALLGVGNITSKTGCTVLLCLSERELSVCRGLF